MQAGTEASRYSGGSERKDTSSRRMMLVYLASGRDDTSSGRLTGNLNSSIFSAESSENALTSGILVYSTFTHK
jgi:hypothetical protein